MDIKSRWRSWGGVGKLEWGRRIRERGESTACSGEQIEKEKS